VRFSFSTFFSFFAIFHVIQCAILIFHVFRCFYPYSWSYSVCVSFYTFFMFFGIFQSYSVHFSFSMFFSISHHIPDHTLCLIFQVFQFSHHNTGTTLCFHHFPTFSVFPAIFQVLQCAFLIFQVFQCFLPYSRSYSVHLSFSTMFRVSCHIPGYIVFVSPFPLFSVFLTIFIFLILPADRWPTWAQLAAVWWRIKTHSFPCSSTNNLVMCCRCCFKMLNNQTLICILIVIAISLSSQLLKIVRPPDTINSQICNCLCIFLVNK
jgi:hypothetical protein